MDVYRSLSASVVHKFKQSSSADCRVRAKCSILYSQRFEKRDLKSEYTILNIVSTFPELQGNAA